MDPLGSFAAWSVTVDYYYITDGCHRHLYLNVQQSTIQKKQAREFNTSKKK